MRSARLIACLAAIPRPASYLLLGRKNFDNVSPQIIPESRSEIPPFPGSLEPLAVDPLTETALPQYARECTLPAPRSIPRRKCEKTDGKGGGSPVRCRAVDGKVSGL